MRPLSNLSRIRLAFVLMLVAIWSLLLRDMFFMIDLDQREEQRQVENLANVGAKALQSAVRMIDNTLLDFREEWPDKPEQFDQQVENLRLRRVFDFDYDINVIDAQGRLAFSTMGDNVGLDLSDRPHFITMRDSGQDMLLISPLQKAKILDRWMLNFSRPLLDKRGRFNGMIIFSVQPDYIGRLYNSLNLGEDGVMTVVRDDTVVLMRIPEVPRDFSRPVGDRDEPIVDGISVRRSPFDQIERLIASKKTSDYPMTLMVGRPTRTLERTVAAHQLRYLLSGIVISALGLLLMIFITRNENDREHQLNERAEQLQAMLLVQRELTDSRAKLRELARHEILIKEEEHKRIAQEIHDELGQRLTVLRMELAMLPRTLPAPPSEPLTEQVAALKSGVDDLLAIVRNVVNRLRPSGLDVGLVAAVETVLHGWQKRAGIACELSNQLPAALQLSELVTVAAFRILQESITNVMRHAQASRVQVTLAVRDASQLLLQVRDDGRGFDPALANNTGSFGLRGMRERAEALGGSLQISSAAGTGTLIEAIIPLQPSDIA